MFLKYFVLRCFSGTAIKHRYNSNKAGTTSFWRRARSEFRNEAVCNVSEALISVCSCLWQSCNVSARSNALLGLARLRKSLSNMWLCCCRYTHLYTRWMSVQWVNTTAHTLTRLWWTAAARLLRRVYLVSARRKHSRHSDTSAGDAQWRRSHRNSHPKIKKVL